ncbi:MAG: hypothetical protein WKF89_15705 [Chitinophagaceae bacterium]
MKVLPATICHLYLLFAITTYSQSPTYDTAEVQRIVRRIQTLQATEEKGFFDGMFPAYREYHHRRGKLKNDDNIFFTGIIAFTLRRLQPLLDSTSSNICDSILASASTVYRHYKSTSGRPSYNFWQKDPPEIFPNGGWLNLFNKAKALADDLDDTAILSMAQNSADSTALQVHTLMQAYTNTKERPAKGTLEMYRNIYAYSSWFGEMMPREMDVCILSNALLFVHSYHLPYSAADSASITFISKVVENRHYLQEGLAISPNYPRTPVIIYHIARLMSESTIPELEKQRPQLIADAKDCYKKTTNFLDRVMLSTSLLRLGVQIPYQNFYIDSNLETLVEDNNFIFFQANMFSLFNRRLNKLIDKLGIGKFYYYCPAWNETLLLENLIWSTRVR